MSGLSRTLRPERPGSTFHSATMTDYETSNKESILVRPQGSHLRNSLDNADPMGFLENSGEFGIERPQYCRELSKEQALAMHQPLLGMSLFIKSLQMYIICDSLPPVIWIIAFFFLNVSFPTLAIPLAFDKCLFKKQNKTQNQFRSKGKT